MKEPLVRLDVMVKKSQKAKLKKEQNTSHIVREAIDLYYAKKK